MEIVRSWLLFCLFRYQIGHVLQLGALPTGGWYIIMEFIEIRSFAGENYPSFIDWIQVSVVRLFEGGCWLKLKLESPANLMLIMLSHHVKQMTGHIVPSRCHSFLLRLWLIINSTTAMGHVCFWEYMFYRWLEIVYRIITQLVSNFLWNILSLVDYVCGYIKMFHFQLQVSWPKAGLHINERPIHALKERALVYIL